MTKKLSYYLMIVGLAYLLLCGYLVLRADEVSWISLSDERHLVVLRVDEAPQNAVIELWAQGSVLKMTRSQLILFVNKETE